MTATRLSFLYPIVYSSAKPGNVFKPRHHHPSSSSQEAIIDHVRDPQRKAVRQQHRRFSPATRGWLDQVRERHGTAIEPPPELRGGAGGPPGPGGMTLPAEVKKPVETDRIEDGKRSGNGGIEDKLQTSGRSDMGRESSFSQQQASSSGPKNTNSTSDSSTKLPETVLHIDPSTSSSSLRQQKQKQKQAQTQGDQDQGRSIAFPHHDDAVQQQHHHSDEIPLFDTYTIVRDLESKGFTQPQSITLMKTIRSLLLSNLDHANGELVSKSDVENVCFLPDTHLYYPRSILPPPFQI